MIDLETILEKLKALGQISGSTDGIIIDKTLPILEADEYSLCWISAQRKDFQTLIQGSASRLIICSNQIKLNLDAYPNKCFLQVPNPRLTFLRVAKDLFSSPKPYAIHKSCVIDPQAKVAQSCSIGPFTYLGNCIIGKGTSIGGNCFIHDGVQIGENVKIGSGTVIGSDGFGYELNENGEYEKFPHLGGVQIHQNVEIGSNVSIDKGSLGNTVIYEGVKIDNLVHIAHNVQIGRNSSIVAHAMIGGSVIIGEGVWVSPSASIIDGIRIGDFAFIGLGAVVVKEVPENEVWAGCPAKFMKTR